MVDIIADKMKCGIRNQEGLWVVKIYYQGKMQIYEFPTYAAADKKYDFEMGRLYGSLKESDSQIGLL